jgi:hypothetical protein
MERCLRRNFFIDGERKAKRGTRVRTTNATEWQGLPLGTDGKVIRTVTMHTGFVLNKTEMHIVVLGFYKLPRRRKPVVYVFTKKEYEQYIEEVGARPVLTIVPLARRRPDPVAIV